MTGRFACLIILMHQSDACELDPGVGETGASWW